LLGGLFLACYIRSIPNIVETLLYYMRCKRWLYASAYNSFCSGYLG